MSGALPLDAALLASLIPGCMLYGVFLVLFVTTLYVLVHRYETRRPNLFLLSVSIFMFIDATISETLAILHIFDAFIVYRDSIGIVPYLSNVGQGLLAARTSLLGVDFICADLVLIYRCWTVWTGNRRIVILSILLFIANIVIGCAGIYFVAQKSNSTPVHAFAAPDIDWSIAFMSFTLLQNITTTALIAWRIWTVHAGTRKHPQNRANLAPIISLIVETGSIYVATQFVLLITYVSGSNALFIMCDIMNQTIGIIFTLLIARVGLGIDLKNSGRTIPSTSDPYSSVSTPTTGAVIFQRQVDSGDPAVDGPVPVELHLCKTSDTVAQIA